MRVLIVEDEMRLAESIATLLQEHHIASDVVHDGLDAIEYATVGSYDVIVLDVMIPGADGFDVVKVLRERNNNTPVLFLTSKDTIQDKVRGLNQGGDDYLTKPFNALELVARIHALTRRTQEIVATELKYGNLILNQNTHHLSCGSLNLQLGAKEYNIMELLMSHPGQVFSKEQIINKVWGLDNDIEPSNVETYISFLRKKLSYLETSVSIKTLRKVGYSLVNHHD